MLWAPQHIASPIHLLPEKFNAQLWLNAAPSSCRIDSSGFNVSTRHLCVPLYFGSCFNPITHLR